MESFTVRLGELAQAEPALGRLAKKELPLKVSFHVARLCRKVASEFRLFEEQRAALVRRLGEPMGTNGDMRVAPQHLAEFISQVDEVAAVVVTIDCPPLTRAELEGVPQLALSPEDLLLIEPFLREGTDGHGDAVPDRDRAGGGA